MAAERPKRAWRWQRLAMALIVLGGAVLAGWVLYVNSDELLAAADTLTRVSWAWVGVALVAEIVSYWMRGAAQRTVLRSGVTQSGSDGRPGLRAVTLGSATLAGDAAAYCLPFGFAASGVVMFGVLRRRMVPPAIAGWLFAVSTVLYVGAVAVLTIAAVQIAGSADPIPGLQTASALLLGGLVLLGLLYAVLRRGPAAKMLAVLRARSNQRLATRDPAETRHWLATLGVRVTGAVRGWVAQLRVVRLPFTVGLAASALMMLSWFADISVLGIGFVALGGTPPWSGLLLAYCAGQIAAALPATPGGLGAVEGSLTVALVAFGGAETITLAAVLLYRLITYWGCIPVGGLAWLLLRATAPAAADVDAEHDQRPAAVSESAEGT